MQARKAQVRQQTRITDYEFVIGDEKEAKNVVAYLKTRFVRFLLSTILLTQNIAKDKFAYIPVLDFTSNNDINWCKSTLEIDQQLYLKYHLTDEEIAFIEKMIKPM